VVPHLGWADGQGARLMVIVGPGNRQCSDKRRENFSEDILGRKRGANASEHTRLARVGGGPTPWGKLLGRSPRNNNYFSGGCLAARAADQKGGDRNRSGDPTWGAVLGGGLQALT